jgi:hypothetical protein
LSDLKQGKKRGKIDITSLNVNGRIIHNQQTIADSFNKYFSNVAEKLIETNYMDKMNLTHNVTTLDKAIRNSKQLYPSIQFKRTSSKEIEKIIKSLKTTNAQGFDEISARILKWSAPFISSPLAYICNRSLETGIFPARLKYSTVAPTFKAGERLIITNYRPISILIPF